MGGLFSKKKSSATLNSDEKAMLDCKLARDKIKQYIKRLEKNAALKKEKAKEAMKAKNKDRARMLLKQAKMYSEQIKSADGQLNMIEDQISALETAFVQRDCLKTLEQGNAALKQLQSECNIEKWEKVRDDLEVMKEANNEITEFFKEKGIGEEEVEDDLNKEMEKLSKELSIEVDIDLPDAHNEKVFVPEEQKEEVKPKKQLVGA